MNITNAQAARWIKEQRLALADFDTLPSLEAKLSFLSEQYFRLTLIANAIDGEVRFIGVPPIEDESDELRTN
jgi:hypothetical protein